MNDIVKAYEAYCDFVDLIADDDIVASVGMEGLNNEETKNLANTAKNVKKRNGLIAAIDALIEGITGFFRALLGLEKNDPVNNVTMYAPPGAPEINIQAIERELIRNVNLLAKTNRNSPEFATLSAKCEALLKDFKIKSEQVADAAEKYKKQYGEKPFALASKRTYEANIGRTTKNMRKLKKAAQESKDANKEVVRYVDDFMRTVRAIANHTQINNPDKSKVWTDKKAASAMKSAAKDVEKYTTKASEKSNKLEKRENA